MSISAHLSGAQPMDVYLNYRKKVMRTITHSHYTAHTEPLLKELKLNLVNVSDMFSVIFIKCIHKLSHDDLSLYFDIYRSYLNKIVTPYSLRKHPFPLPVIAHTFAESSLVFQLVKMKNNISVNDTLILKKIEVCKVNISSFINCSSSLNHFLLIIVYTSVS